MIKRTLKPIARHYSNNGQHAEQVYRYTVTGKITKADNLSHKAGADCGNVQIKSPRATVCEGTLNIAKYLEEDAATIYALVTSDFTTAYEMNRSEYIEFATEFKTIDCNSKTNAVKIRIKHESKRMIEWLEARVG